MELREITDYEELIPLYDRYIQGTPNLTGTQFVDSLLTLDNYKAFGVYKKNELIAFIDGYELTSKVYKLGNVYKGKGTARDILKLYNYFELNIAQLGYIGWRVDSTRDTINIVKKLGAVTWEQPY